MLSGELTGQRLSAEGNAGGRVGDQRRGLERRPGRRIETREELGKVRVEQSCVIPGTEHALHATGALKQSRHGADVLPAQRGFEIPSMTQALDRRPKIGRMCDEAKP